MINQHELYAYIEEVLPEIKSEMIPDKIDNPYTVMNALLKLTTKKTKEHKYDIVKKCFQVADRLYSKGNSVVRIAVENVFVYSFDGLFQSCNAERRNVMALVPVTLYTLYINQHYQHGC